MEKIRGWKKKFAAVAMNSASERGHRGMAPSCYLVGVAFVPVAVVMGNLQVVKLVELATPLRAAKNSALFLNVEPCVDFRHDMFNVGTSYFCCTPTNTASVCVTDSEICDDP